MTGVTRRDLLRFRRKQTEMRPPWAAAEDSFLDRCSRCGDCLRACPERVLGSGDGGFPVISFASRGCSFCGDCVAACKTGALLRREDAAPLPLLAGIAAHCLSLTGVTCRVCGEWCQEGAIGFRLLPGGKAEPRVDADRCTGCGDCISRCPVKAVAMAFRPETQKRAETEKRACA